MLRAVVVVGAVLVNLQHGLGNQPLRVWGESQPKPGLHRGNGPKRVLSRFIENTFVESIPYRPPTNSRGLRALVVLGGVEWSYL